MRFRTLLRSARHVLILAAALAMLPLSTSAHAKKLCMVAGRPSHGPGEHEFNAGTRLLADCLKDAPRLEVAVQLGGWPKDNSFFDGADAIFLYMDGGGGHPAIQPQNLEFLRGLMKKGVGLGCAHYAVEVPKDKGGPEWIDWIGGHYETLYSCNPMWEPDYQGYPGHPIARGVKPFKIRDEWYMNMRFRPEMKGVTSVLAAPPSDQVRKGPYVAPQGPYPHIVEAMGRSETMMWCVEREDGGRGFGFTGGHFHKNWGDDNFRKVVLNALLWISKVEVPAAGFESKVTPEQLAANLDPKGKK